MLLWIFGSVLLSCWMAELRDDGPDLMLLLLLGWQGRWQRGKTGPDLMLLLLQSSCVAVCWTAYHPQDTLCNETV